MVESVSLNFYSEDLEKEFQVDVDLISKSDSSFYQIIGIYERDLNIERDLDEFCLVDRIKIRDICKDALFNHHL